MSKRILLVGGLVVAMVAQAGVGGRDVDAGPSAVLKIGVPLALTGPIAEQAEEMVRGYQLYLKQHGNQLGGLPVQLIVEDTQADPSVVIAKTRKLIESDHVDLIGGGALVLESLAIEQVTVPRRVAFITPISSADDLTQRKLVATFARTNMTSSQPNLYLGQWVYQHLGYRRVAVMAQDYAYGWESAGGFQYAFEKSGGKMVQKLFVPLTTTDYAPFVRQLDRHVDAVYAILVGANVPRFEKAYNQFGLRYHQRVWKYAEGGVSCLLVEKPGLRPKEEAHRHGEVYQSGGPFVISHVGDVAGLAEGEDPRVVSGAAGGGGDGISRPGQV